MTRNAFPTVVVAALWACGGTNAVTPDAGSDAADASVDATEATPEASADSASDATSPPVDAGPDGPLPAPGSNFAMHSVFLGDTDRGGNPNPGAWATYGRNVDGKITTASSTDVCTLVSGALSSTQIDGAGGVDNSFGENILPLFETLFGSSFSTQLNLAIGAGVYSMMVDVVGLTSDPQQSSSSTAGQFFLGAPFPTTPTWTVADDWPVRPDLLKDFRTVASGSTIQFGTGAISAGSWSSGTPVDLPFFILTPGLELVGFTIHEAVISFDHASPTEATNGTVSGVLAANEFIPAMKILFDNLSASLCTGSAWDSIAAQLSQASDILSDGTNAAGRACNGISIGLGFTADQIGAARSVGAELVPPSDPCDAGTD